MSILRDKILIPKKCRFIDTTRTPPTTDHFTPRCTCTWGNNVNIETVGILGHPPDHAWPTRGNEVNCVVWACTCKQWQCRAGLRFKIEASESWNLNYIASGIYPPLKLPCCTLSGLRMRTKYCPNVLALN